LSFPEKAVIILIIHYRMSTMKRRFISGLFFCLTVFLAGAQDRLMPRTEAAVPIPGYSMAVIANRIKADSAVIYVNGERAAHLLAGETVSVLIPDGRRRQVKAVQLRWNRRRNTWAEVDDDTRTFDCQAQRITMEITSDPDLKIVRQEPLTYDILPRVKEAVSALTEAVDNTEKAGRPQSSLEAALYKAAEVIMAKIPHLSNIAVLNVASGDTVSAEFAVDELTYVIVNRGFFKVVDRKSLDSVRSEQNFQMTEDVDDDSAVSIGKLLGANIVITGSITGADSTRRLRFKVLDVTTAEIIAMASEPF
jgi:hypothetical protein